MAIGSFGSVGSLGKVMEIGFPSGWVGPYGEGVVKDGIGGNFGKVSEGGLTAGR